MTIFMLWSLLFGLCIVLELSSPGFFFFLSFALGALAAAGIAWFELSIVVEMVLFFGVSAVSFMVLRWYARHIGKKEVRTNVYALKGKKGVVLADITPLERGWVKIDGETWAAAPFDDCSFEKGTIVEVVSISGAHVKVRKSIAKPEAQEEC
jgi:membrane protein implicated in regulation of membrane protease activity